MKRIVWIASLVVSGAFACAAVASEGAERTVLADAPVFAPAIGKYEVVKHQCFVNGRAQIPDPSYTSVEVFEYQQEPGTMVVARTARAGQTFPSFGVFSPENIASGRVIVEPGVSYTWDLIDYADDSGKIWEELRLESTGWVYSENGERRTASGGEQTRYCKAQLKRVN